MTAGRYIPTVDQHHHAEAFRGASHTIMQVEAIEMCVVLLQTGHGSNCARKP